MGTAAAGSSPSAQAPAPPPGTTEHSSSSSSSNLDAVIATTPAYRGTSATAGITSHSLQTSGKPMAGGRGGFTAGNYRGSIVVGGESTIVGSRANEERLAASTVVASAATRGILSPAVLSRARRLLVGISNIDKNVDARKLASEALVALGVGS